MSIINQVLSDLEKRGAASSPSDAVIRAVPVQARQNQRWLIAAAGVLAVLTLGWWGTPKKNPVSSNVISQPISTAPIVADSPVAAPLEISLETPAIVAPAMRLSFELSAIPLPSHARSAQAREKEERTHQLASATASDKQLQAEKPEEAKKPEEVKKPDKQIKQISPQQQLDNEFRKATTLLQQGRSNEAYSAYEVMLQRDAGYDAARQAMVGILLEGKRNAEAERLLQDGLQHNVKNSGFAMLLARLQVERGELGTALETLQKTLPYAERQADYQAFVAALLQRQNNHPQAIAHYQAALQLSPNSGLWLMGLGMSLQAEQHKEEARAAFKRALESNTLSAELRAFVEQRMKEL